MGCNTKVELGPKTLHCLDVPKVHPHCFGAAIVRGGASINQVPTLLRSDNEDTLHTLLKATAAKLGSMIVRHSPAYSSNSQGSVERLHRTLLGQIRTFKAQVERGITLNVKHPLPPWIIRHAAWTINRYVIHPDGYTSFKGRWRRNYERTTVEFRKTLLHMPPQHKSLPKAELRMQKWLGKVSETGEIRGYRTRSDESTHGEETTTGLQIRPRTTEQDNRNSMVTET